MKKMMKEGFEFKKGKKQRSFLVRVAVGMVVGFCIVGAAFVVVLPPMGSIQIAANLSKDKRNAQNLALVFHSAFAAGSNELREVDSVWAAVAVIRRGTYGSGSFEDQKFEVPNMSDEVAREAMRHLIWNQGEGESFGRIDYEADHGVELIDTEPPPEKEDHRFNWR